MGSGRARSSNGCSVVLGALALTASLARGARAGDVEERLDALAAMQRPAGGWMLPSAPGTRPEPLTLVVRGAEHLLAPVGLATWDLVVVRSPGTPAAGLVLLEGHRRTGRAGLLAAARRAGDFLVATELDRGGWFSEIPVEGESMPWWFRWSADTRPMLDDDVTPGAIRFLLALWKTTGEVGYRASAERGLALLAGAQLPSGAWPLDARPEWLRRLHPHYEDQPALNDGATPFAITTLLAAADALRRPELLASARAGGDWLLRVQGAPPRAGWAQQYTPDGAPAVARRFELPALATWETRHAIEALVALADATGDRRYCDGALAAAAWLAAVRASAACWPRFLDVQTGAPVFVDADGARVASPRTARPGYSWMGEFGIPWVLARLGIEGGAPPRRLPGDPGRCLDDPNPPPPLAGARAAIAEVATLLATDDMVAPSTCRVTPPDARP